MMKRLSNRAAAAAAAATVALIALIAVVLSVGQPAAARHAPQSIFQDDNHLLYADRATVGHTLDVLKALGVDRIRVTVEWAYLAPAPTSTTKPAAFDASNPAAYPKGAWSRYDRVVRMARVRGIAVDFNVTAPGPVWAMGRAPTKMQFGATAQAYAPSAAAFGRFVHALGTRYSGSYVPPTRAGAHRGRALPRVNFWSIWNEPNQPGWLAPQWRSAHGGRVPQSPRLYRSLIDAAVGGLQASGHTVVTDTILIGETAPEGAVVPVAGTHPPRYVSATGADDAMPPMVFLRALYCVNSSYQRLTGAAATALGCPANGSAATFLARNRPLFEATGFAHHPYYFQFAPNVSSPIADYVPLANLGRLERGLDRAFADYGVHRKIPIYLTEYGYQTNPPDPNLTVTPAQQAAYLNEADYMAWRDARVRSVAQFLLYDSGPDTKYPPTSISYWGSTFQTGLLYGPGTSLAGRPKPALAAYALPIWIPDPNPPSGSKLLIWGMLRLAPNTTAQIARVQWRPLHQRAYQTLATVAIPASDTRGYFTTRLTPPGRGKIRIAWRSHTGATFTSRAVSIGAGSALGASIPAGSGFAPIAQTYSETNSVPPCRFSPAELQAAVSSASNNELQYDEGFLAAIEEARQQQASGACAHGQSPSQATSTPASTPEPPPAPRLGGTSALDVGSPTAATRSGLPVPVIILLVVAGLVTLSAMALGTARLRGWDPVWAVRTRHSWSEAGYRVAGLWSEFVDWLRRGA